MEAAAAASQRVCLAPATQQLIVNVHGPEGCSAAPPGGRLCHGRQQPAPAAAAVTELRAAAVAASEQQQW